MNELLLTLFSKYSELLKKRFSEDFTEIVSTDDYMPMTLNSIEEYDKVVTVSWYTPEKDREELTYAPSSSILQYLTNMPSFPCVLPFSQMYPLCCIDVRNFLNQIYLFSDDYFQKSSVIDETLRTSLDDLLCNEVCQSLVDRLASQYPGQIVQILTNVEHFETACHELEVLLFEARSSPSATGPITLQATEKFKAAKKQASDRIFEVVNSKIDQLVETAEYDWMATKQAAEPSDYMKEMTRWLSDISNSVLLALPEEVKGFVYFDALSHAKDAILALPLDDSVKRITPAAVSALEVDTRYLASFVEGLGDPLLLDNLDELTQTVALMGTDDVMEYFDVAQRNKKYGKVDPLRGQTLIGKVQEGAQIANQSPTKPPERERFGTLGSRFRFGGS